MKYLIGIALIAVSGWASANTLPPLTNSGTNPTQQRLQNEMSTQQQLHQQQLHLQQENNAQQLQLNSQQHQQIFQRRVQQSQP